MSPDGKEGGAARRLPGASWAPPERVEEYRLLRLLGRGGMGQVYLAEDTLLARHVAVKFIASLRPDESARQRFQLEARAIARLSHPNVVSVHRVGEIDGRPYLVAEFVRGQSLAELARPVPWERALRIGLGLARGMAAAHRQGVLHRDIKPANAMLTEDEEVKLLDFGLAKLLGPPAAAPSLEDSAGGLLGGASELSGAGGLMGTPLYMAPEVLRGEPATRRSDIYSLGAVLYELCAGVAPRQSSRDDLSFEDWVALEPVPISERVKDVEPRFAAAVARCLQQEPERRFGSADDLCSALEEVDPERAAGEMPEGNPYRGLQPFEAEHRALFFGRSAEAQTIIDRLRAEPLVVVTGDSGVGKSSLCRAGVLPRIVEGALGEERSYRVLSLVPGRQPFAALVSTLAASHGLEEEQLAASLLQSHPWVLGKELRRTREPGSGAVLFVDQAEELFALSVPEEASRFSEAISRLSASSAGVRVLMAVRGDFFTRLASLPGLGEEVSRALYLLRPLSPEGIRAAITRPALQKGVRFETEALVEELVESSTKAVGGLPLLQFAMAELWKARDEARQLIPAAALGSIGGVSGALARHADGVLAELLPEQRSAARRLLLRLVTAEETRARRTGPELDAGEPTARAALEGLVRGRLLVAREVDGETAYEVAHEALLREWGTLRRWLETDGERRQVRERVEAAAAEWSRLGHAQEALWTERLLAEVGRMDDGELSPRGAGFLRASKSRALRTRYRRLGLMVAAPLIVGLVVLGIKLKARWDLEELVAGHTKQARSAVEEGQRKKAEAQELRRKAYALFDAAGGGTVEEAAARNDEAEQVWSSALEALGQADEAFAQADRSLEAAFALDPSGNDVRDQIGGVTAERLELAEWFHQKERRKTLLDRLNSYGSEARKRWFTQAPRLSIATSPPGAEVILERYKESKDGYWEWESVGRPGKTPLAGFEVPGGPGSYLLTFEAPGRAPVRYPVLLARGEALSIDVALPRAEDIPEGYVYIPKGRFLFGSADPDEFRSSFVNTQPLHEIQTGAYLIGKKEVTFKEWIEFLEDLSPAERKKHLPHADLRQWGLELEQLPAGDWLLKFSLNGQKLMAREGEQLHIKGRTVRAQLDWSRLPVAGISLGDALAYLSWLDRTGRVRGARLCDEREWERAARGADGRAYPHGNKLKPSDANFDRTYGRKPDAFGPDEVGSYPETTSPFGLLDMTGNVYELAWSIGARGEILIRGGAWYFDAVSVLAANRTVIEPKTRAIDNGLRVCADAPSE